MSAGGDSGEPHATHADRPEDLKVRVANIAVPRRGGGGGQFAPEFAQEPHEQLTDGQSIGGQIS